MVKFSQEVNYYFYRNFLYFNSCFLFKGFFVQNNATVLKQQFFYILASLVVLKIDGPPTVCRTDEVGEICMSSNATGSAYWGLPGLTNTTFRVKPLVDEGSTLTWDTEFVRTGLLGFLGPVGAFKKL